MILIIVATTLALDQLTKFLATRYLLLNDSSPVIKGIFHLSLVHNRGAAFGILKGQLSLFIVASIFAIALIYASLKDSGRSKIYRISLVLILAGALGNLIDRVFFGYVIDFLDFRVWPVFNLADSAITIGAVLLGWFILKGK
jgi:signal peptidase II